MRKIVALDAVGRSQNAAVLSRREPRLSGGQVPRARNQMVTATAPGSR